MRGEGGGVGNDGVQGTGGSSLACLVFKSSPLFGRESSVSVRSATLPPVVGSATNGGLDSWVSSRSVSLVVDLGRLLWDVVAALAPLKASSSSCTFASRMGHATLPVAALAVLGLHD